MPSTQLPTASPAPPATGLGIVITTLANWFGQAPEDFALCAAVVLGGIAGPRAGARDSLNRRVAPGLSVLRLPGGDATFRGVEAFLLEAPRVQQYWLRKRASGIKKSVLDSVTFGPGQTYLHNPDNLSLGNDLWIKHRERVQNHFKAAENGQFYSPELENPTDDPIPPDLAGMTSLGLAPGHFHAPSFLLEGMPFEHLHRALGESHQHEALLVDTSGGLLSSISKDKKLAPCQWQELGRLLEGCEFLTPRIHPDQGYGSFRRGRINLWSSAAPETVGSWIGQANGAQDLFLTKCLVWKPETRSRKSLPPLQTLEVTRELYNAAVERAIVARTRGSGVAFLVLDDPQLAATFASEQAKFADALGGVESRFAPYVAGFHDLPAKLLWACWLLKHPREEFWCLNAAFYIAHRLLQRHVSCLAECERLAIDHAARPVANKLLVILLANGPLKFREMAHRSNLQRRDQLMPGLSLLMREGRVAIDERKRYRLASSEPPPQFSAA